MLIPEKAVANWHRWVIPGEVGIGGLGRRMQEERPRRSERD